MNSRTRGSVVFRDVVKKFGQVTAIKRLNMSIEPGKLVTFLGPSGCGKTTTLRLIAGLELVGLKGYGPRLPSELSGGQQQRVAVARAIVLEPEVLLLDEPLSNLDAKLRRHVREEIRQIQQNLGLTAIYVTHDQEEAMAVSDSIVVMRNAEIAQQGSPRDLYERPNSSFIADFIGDANLVDCEVVATQGERSEIIVAGRRLSLATSARQKGAGKLVLRPHQISLSREKVPGAYEGVVSYGAYLGNQTQYTIEGELGELFVVTNDTGVPIATGDNVWISFEPDQARLVDI